MAPGVVSFVILLWLALVAGQHPPFKEEKLPSRLMASFAW